VHHRGLHRDHQVEVGDQGGELGEVVDVLRREEPQGRSPGGFGGDVAVLQADELGVGQGEERRELIEVHGAALAVGAGRAAAPGAADPPSAVRRTEPLRPGRPPRRVGGQERGPAEVLQPPTEGVRQAAPGGDHVDRGEIGRRVADVEEGRLREGAGQQGDQPPVADDAHGRRRGQQVRQQAREHQLVADPLVAHHPHALPGEGLRRRARDQPLAQPGQGEAGGVGQEAGRLPARLVVRPAAGEVEGQQPHEAALVGGHRVRRVEPLGDVEGVHRLVAAAERTQLHAGADGPFGASRIELGGFLVAGQRVGVPPQAVQRLAAVHPGARVGRLQLQRLLGGGQAVLRPAELDQGPGAVDVRGGQPRIARQRGVIDGQRLGRPLQVDQRPAAVHLRRQVRRIQGQSGVVGAQRLGGAAQPDERIAAGGVGPRILRVEGDRPVAGGERGGGVPQFQLQARLQAERRPAVRLNRQGAIDGGQGLAEAAAAGVRQGVCVGVLRRRHRLRVLRDPGGETSSPPVQRQRFGGAGYWMRGRRFSITAWASKARGSSAGLAPLPMTTSAEASKRSTVRTSTRSAQNGSPQNGSQLCQP
jgi:hypothetical protein